MGDQGVHFYNCDFQVHTPRDINWKGKRPTSDKDRKAYAERFIKACHEKRLDAVAITDHHDMEFVEYIRNAALSETDKNEVPVPEGQKVIVFPRMELTLGVPCQALLVFDADLPKHLFEKVYTTLTINRSSSCEEKTAPVERLDFETLGEVCEALDKQKDLIGRYILLPNVTDEGKSSLLRTGFYAKYKEMPCVGAYIDGNHKELDKGTLNIIEGSDKKWGNKKVAIFQISDNRKETFEDLGKHSTWVKWAEPTAEALRQACLAGATRIVYPAPSLPLTYIKKINVSDSEFMGSIDIDFNPQYSVFIGGRGTGKSTVLEYLRWGLCDHSLQNTVDENSEYKKRNERLIEDTLKSKGGTVEITISVNGIDYIIERSTKNSRICWKKEGEDFQEAKSDDIRSLLSIQAYSQKQISEVGVRVDELKRFLYSPIIKELKKIDSNFETLSNEIRKIYAEVREKRTIEEEISKQKILIENFTAQAEEMKKSLKDLNEDDQKIIHQNAIYQKINSAVEVWKQEISLVSERFFDFMGRIENFQGADLPENLEQLPDNDRKQIEELRQKMDNFYSEIKGDSYLIREKIEASKNEERELQGQFKSWAKRLEEFDIIYDETKKKSSAHQSKLSRLRELEESTKAAQSRLSRLETELQALGALLDNYRHLTKEWASLHRERSDLIERECKKLSEYSKSEIKAELLVGHEFSKIEKALKRVMEGTGIRKSTKKIDNIKNYVTENETPLDAWSRIIQEFEDIARFDHKNYDIGHLPKTDILLEMEFSPTDLHNLSAEFNLDAWLELSLLPLKDGLSFNYRKGDTKYIPFQYSSAGQRATSLLRSLLNQPGPPLIIDQPEDDLDNKTIYEVVEQIWEAKGKRQIIFASHNANLVVNGDADLVICCSYKESDSQARGEIESTGAIDIVKTKNAIKRIIEGGDEAFELRRQKYGF